MHEVLAPLIFVLEYDSEVFQFLENSDKWVEYFVYGDGFIDRREKQI
jgi:hypothetical protein